MSDSQSVPTGDPQRPVAAQPSEDIPEEEESFRDMVIRAGRIVTIMAKCLRNAASWSNGRLRLLLGEENTILFWFVAPISWSLFALLCVVPFYILGVAAFSPPSTPAAAQIVVQSSSTSVTTTSSPNRASGTDAWVDEQVEKNWRPMPNGNSKADAAQVSKDIMNARSFEDLERLREKHTREGR